MKILIKIIVSFLILVGSLNLRAERQERLYEAKRRSNGVAELLVGQPDEAASGETRVFRDQRGGGGEAPFPT